VNAPSVLLLDYGSGNLRSAQRALEKVGADVTVSADFDAAMAADGLLVPGVGAYGACMKGIREVRGDMLVDRRLSGGRPVMGICVGMQVMFDQGVEHGVETEGLGQWPGVVEELQAPILPHMGWNTVRVAHDSTLFEGVMGERFYFVHSYAVRHWDFVARDDNQNSPAVTWSHHGEDFIAAVENGPLVATQFHPEKSGDAGLHLLENWVKSLR
jgi:glutamine amidotransferase